MERLLKRISINDVTGCWNWTGALDEKGYGLMSVKKRTKRVHRMAYEFYRGPIPEGLFVCHKCDNPKCFNPAHLFVGTALDNNRDREAKGRGADRHGEKHPSFKLTDAQVAEVRKLGDSKTLTHKAISLMFGVTRARISQIIRRQDRVVQ